MGWLLAHMDSMGRLRDETMRLYVYLAEEMKDYFRAG